MNQKISKNSRKWGVTWSTNPTGHGTDIEIPCEPMFTGTLRQCDEWLRNQLRPHASGGVYYNYRFFWNGHPVRFSESIFDQRQPDFDIETGREVTVEFEDGYTKRVESDTNIIFRLTTAQKSQIEKNATKAGMTMTDYILSKCL